MLNNFYFWGGVGVANNSFAYVYSFKLNITIVKYQWENSWRQVAAGPREREERNFCLPGDYYAAHLLKLLHIL